MLSCHAIGILDQSLELVVLSESDDLQHSAKLGENLGRGDNTIKDDIMTTHLRKKFNFHYSSPTITNMHILFMQNYQICEVFYRECKL